MADEFDWPQDAELIDGAPARMTDPATGEVFVYVGRDEYGLPEYKTNDEQHGSDKPGRLSFEALDEGRIEAEHDYPTFPPHPPEADCEHDWRVDPAGYVYSSNPPCRKIVCVRCGAIRYQRPPGNPPALPADPEFWPKAE